MADLNFSISFSFHMQLLLVFTRLLFIAYLHYMFRANDHLQVYTLVLQGNGYCRWVSFKLALCWGTCSVASAEQYQLKQELAAVAVTF
jgi:hypothetical protein